MKSFLRTMVCWRKYRYTFSHLYALLTFRWSNNPHFLIPKKVLPLKFTEFDQQRFEDDSYKPLNETLVASLQDRLTGKHSLSQNFGYQSRLFRMCFLIQSLTFSPLVVFSRSRPGLPIGPKKPYAVEEWAADRLSTLCARLGERPDPAGGVFPAYVSETRKSSCSAYSGLYAPVSLGEPGGSVS